MTPERPHAAALRRGRVSLAGAVYLITTVTRQRQPLFADWRCAREVVRALMGEAALGRADTLAYVVMPDHVHWLMQLRGEAALSAVVRSVKSVSAHRLGAAVWQPGFHDHALRADEDVVAAARYVVANPLRAGLVHRLADYPHWDAVWLGEDERELW
ncbi:transposase [Comamonas faecalis]|uniref:Transposase n=2 Tax=Comamonas faecalis TaxID=1387849 RepID=A0ABP7QK77_9BURK